MQLDFLYFCVCVTDEFLCSSGESQHTAVQLLFTASLGFLSFIYGREKQHSPLYSVLLAQGKLMAASHLSLFAHAVKFEHQYLPGNHWVRF